MTRVYDDLTYDLTLANGTNTFDGILNPYGNYNWGTYNFAGLGDEGLYNSLPNLIGQKKGKGKIHTTTVTKVNHKGKTKTKVTNIKISYN